MKIRNIAVIVSGIDEEYPYRIILGINDFARSHDLNVSYFTAFGGVSDSKDFDIGEYSIYKLPDLSKFDGILLLANTFSDPDVREMIISRVKKSGAPTVIFERSSEETLHDISTNNYTAMKSLVEHLIKVHGAKVFNYVSGSPNNPEAMERYRAFRDALSENNIEFDEENRLFYGAFRSYDGIRAIEAFKASGMSLPDAFVCANDGMALTAMNKLQHMGYSIPEDVMITGFDCTFNSINSCPALTTINRPLYYSGTKACEILLGLMNKEEQPMRTELTAEPVFSESCGCTNEHSESLDDFKKNIYIRYEQIYTNIHMLNRLIAGLAGAQRIDDCIGVMEQVLRAIDCNDFNLCLVNNWEDAYNVTNLEDQDEYPPIMTAPFIWKDGERHSLKRFHSNRLRPEPLTTGGNISYYIPLHFNQRCLGYYIITNNDFPINSLLCHTMTLSLGNAIDNISKLNVLDPLCRIYNRNGFNQNAEYLLKQCVSESSPVTVCFVDMDKLKSINDNFGHKEGDIAIKNMADAISSACGTVNVCGRFGGDEFVVLGTGDDFAEKFKKRLMSRLENINKKADKPYKLSASLGFITTIPQNSDTLLDLIQQADEKMYEAKKEHRTHRI